MGQGRLVKFGLCVLLSILSACGAKQAGWQSFPVPIYADSPFLSSSSTMESDFKDAMAFWESKAGKKIFDYRGTWSGNTPFEGAPDHPSSITGNVIFFQNPWPFAANIIGQTTVTTSDQEIQAGMIMINPSTSFCAGDCQFAGTQISERKVMAHELGHFIGLQHVNDTKNLMYPESTPGGDLSTVTIDDVILKYLTTR